MAALAAPAARAEDPPTLSLSVDDPPQMTLSHFETAVESGAVHVTSNLSSWTVTIKEHGSETLGRMDRTQGSGPAALHDPLRYRTSIGTYHDLSGQATELFLGSGDDGRTMYFAQSLTDSEDVLHGSHYGLTVSYSALSN